MDTLKIKSNAFDYRRSTRLVCHINDILAAPFHISYSPSVSFLLISLGHFVFYYKDIGCDVSFTLLSVGGVICIPMEYFEDVFNVLSNCKYCS